MSLESDQPDETGPQRATFIVRLVRERRRGSTWRGEVEHVQQGERRPASDPAAALAHVTEWLARLLPPPASHAPRSEKDKRV
jgi:hypothetical protein